MGLLCAALYVALTVALTWPLVLLLGTHVPRDLGDPLLSIWALWWNTQQVPFTAAWWDAPQFHPVHGSMAFSDHRAGLLPITHPVQWAGGSPLAAYNIALLLSFPLSAIAAHLLVHSLTRRHDAALIAGLAFGFNPYRIAHLEHLELIASYWMPVALLALHRYAGTPGWRPLAVFCVAWLLQGLCSSYYLFYFSILIVLWLAWFRPRRLMVLVAGWIGAGLVLVPVLLQYRAIHGALGLQRTRTEILGFSADISGIFSASSLLAFWHSSPALHRPEGETFPGSFVLAITLAAVLIAWRRPVRVHRSHRALLALSAVFGVVALTPLLFGPWRFALAGASLSVSSFRKPLSIAAACFAMYCVWHPRVRAACRGKSTFAFYVLATVALWILSWGPEPTLVGTPVLYQAPYAWLMRFPPFESGLRVPARFAMPAVLALSVAAGLAFARIAALEKRALRSAATLVIGGGIIADGWIRQLPLLTPPAAWVPPAAAGTFTSVLELPIVYGGAQDAAAVYRSISHRHPTVNGFSGYYPAHYLTMKLGLERGERDVLSAIAASGPILVAVDRQNDPDGAWVRYASEQDGASAAGSHREWTFVLISPPDARVLPRVSGRTLPVVRISSNFTSAPMDALVDGNPLTRWMTPGPQRGNEEVVIDIGAVHEVRGLVLSLGVFRDDFPRGLAIETSADGVEWALQWSGRTAALTVAAALEDPHHTRLTWPISGSGRFIRVRQTESDATYYWSVADVRVVAND